MSFASKGFATGQASAVEEKLLALITSGTLYKGTWNASTNTPTLAHGSGTNGWYYEVSASGTWSSIDFLVGDRIIYNGANNKWERVGTGVEDDTSATVVAFVNHTTTALPTQRKSGKPLIVGDYVKVDDTAVGHFPFTIAGITFDSINDQAEWTGTKWQEKSYSAGSTNEVTVNDKTKESIAETSAYQSDINEEVVNEFKKIIIEKDDLASVTTPLARPYYQKTDTTARKKGLYWYNTNSTKTDKWEKWGGSDIDNKTIELNSDGQIQVKQTAYAITTASTEWDIMHNLNKYPQVRCIDSSGNEIIGGITYPNSNQIKISFANSETGIAYIY